MDVFSLVNSKARKLTDKRRFLREIKSVNFGTGPVERTPQSYFEFSVVDPKLFFYGPAPDPQH